MCRGKCRYTAGSGEDICWHSELFCYCSFCFSSSWLLRAARVWTLLTVHKKKFKTVFLTPEIILSLGNLFLCDLLKCFCSTIRLSQSPTQCHGKLFCLFFKKGWFAFFDKAIHIYQILPCSELNLEYKAFKCRIQTMFFIFHCLQYQLMIYMSEWAFKRSQLRFHITSDTWVASLPTFSHHLQKIQQSKIMGGLILHLHGGTYTNSAGF